MTQSRIATISIGVIAVIVAVVTMSRNGQEQPPDTDPIGASTQDALFTGQPSDGETDSGVDGPRLTGDDVEDDPFNPDARPFVSLPAGEREQIIATTRDFITAYKTVSYDDPAASTWVERASEYATTAHAKKLRDRYAKGGNAKKWKAMQDDHYETTIAVNDMAVVEYIPDSYVVMRTDSSVSTSSDSGEYSSSADESHLVTLTPGSGGWKVDDVQYESNIDDSDSYIGD